MATREEARGLLQGWFAGRLPDGWFTGEVDVQVDGDEILVVGTIPEPRYPKGADDDAKRLARAGRVGQFREDTRDVRIAIATEAERRFRRKVSWGVACGPDRELFTTLNVPVMTRLRINERAVLDTLIEGGIARSRSEALAWCVRLVSSHEGEWLADLQQALSAVQAVRAKGPKA